jgi:hypothetical protein
MTAVLWVNIALALPFVLAWAGIPLWMTFKYPYRQPDHAAAPAHAGRQAALAADAGLEPEREPAAV